MYPLGSLSLALFGLLFHCWLQTSPAAFGGKSSRLFPTTARDRLNAILNDAAPNKDVLLNQLTVALQSIEGHCLRAIQYLNVIATVAPMVGLLGTVSGMISAFQTIAAGGMGKPELLAGDIGEALITTATGLTIGIPAMVGYFFLRNRLDTQLELLEKWLDGHLQDSTASKPAVGDTVTSNSLSAKTSLSQLPVGGI